MSARGKWGPTRLRLYLYGSGATAAVESGLPIIPVYILDDDTPGKWSMGGASRWWLAQSLRSLEKRLQRLGSRLIIRRGQTERVLRDLIAETGATAVYFARGYEPFQRALEERLTWSLGRSVELRRFSGQILFEPEKIANASGEPFRVYIPLSTKR
jgi:deoxyribodipyrimidine photo-lyase